MVATLEAALDKQGKTLKALERWKTEMPVEEEMLPKDKYTIFDRKEKRYRKGIHSTFISRIDSFVPPAKQKDQLTHVFTELPKWTRVSQRINPPGY